MPFVALDLVTFKRVLDKVLELLMLVSLVSYAPSVRF
jgi:hypothetical protein